MTITPQGYFDNIDFDAAHRWNDVCLKYFSVDNIKGERSLPRYVVTRRPPHRVARRSVFPSQPFPFPFASFLPRLPSQRVSFRARLSALPWRLLLPLFPCD